MRRPRLDDAVIASALGLAQAIAVAPLFAGSVTRWRSSIESVFVAKARFIVEHFPDLSWMPYWYLGFPFELHYTPLVPAAAAALGVLTGDVASAYRVVAAVGFVLGGPGLYLLARAVGLGRAAAVLGAVVFLAAPSLSELAMPGLRLDAASVTGADPPLPWRLVVLVKYGEGPHVLGLSLALLATAALLGYLRHGGTARFWAATFLFVGVAFANLIALLAAAVFAIGSVLVAGGPLGLGRGLRVGGTAALLSLTWYSPSFIRAVAANPTPGSDPGTAAYLALPLVLGALVVGARSLHAERPTAALLAFWGASFAAIIVFWELFRVSLAPQPIRYASELDAVAALALAAGATWLAARSPLRAAARSAALAAAALVIALASLPAWSSVQANLAADDGWTEWSEHEVALWLRDRLGPGERAYLAGSHALWASAFADVAQVRGGQDYVAVDPWPAHAAHQIKTASDPEVSMLWLRALGVRYVVVTGPESTDVYADFADPAMFEGRLALETTIQGARIYRVERAHTRPVLVAPPGPSATPANAVDRAPLADYVAAVESGTPVTLADAGTGAFAGSVETPSAATLLVPVAYDAGWRAYVDGHGVTVRADALGLLAVDVPAGGGRIELRHRPHTDLLLSNAAVFALLAFLAARSVRRPLPAISIRVPRFTLGDRASLDRVAGLATPAALVASVVAVGLALGAWTGFPKGSDAPSHLTRIRFVADWFPNHDWLYVWAAGMPNFDSYPALPYFLTLVPARLVGAEPTLFALAFLSLVAFALGLHAFLARASGSRAAAFVATLAVVSSLAVWTWLVNNGLYARLLASAFGVWAWYAAERWHPDRSRSHWVATAALLAAAVASHAFMGAVFACVVALRTLARWGWSGVVPTAELAGLALLLGAPAWLPVAFGAGGGTGRFIGAAHGPHVVSGIEVLWSADHVGPAIPVLLGLSLAATLALRRRPPLLFLSLTGITTLYTFAPALGIPNSFYYVNGVDPFTATYFIAVFAACAAALALGPLALRLAPAAALGLTTAVLAVAAGGAANGANALAVTNAVYPRVFDTAAPHAQTTLSQRDLVLADDLAHRVMPNTADESVWISYRSRTPQLRDYYSQGQVHPDWLSFAYTTLYDPPYEARVARAVLDWFGVSIVTVDTGSAFARNLAAMEASGDFAPRPGRERYAVLDVLRPTALTVASELPLTVVAGSEEFYRTLVRTFLREGEGPSRRIPVRWDGAVGDLPADVLARTGLLVVGPRSLGEERGAADAFRAVTSGGGTVVVDLAARPEREVLALLPVSGVGRTEFASDWALRTDGTVDPRGFAPATYEGGPWIAEVGSALRSGGRAILSLGDRPVVAVRTEGAGRIVALGGNILFHADYTQSALERAFVVRDLFGEAGERAPRDLEVSFHDPEHRSATVGGPAVVLFKESHTGAWSATFNDGARVKSLPVLQAGPGLMAAVAPGAGEVAFSYGLRLHDALAWILVAVGFGVIGWPWIKRWVRP